MNNSKHLSNVKQLYPKISFDVDGILADYIKAAADYAGRKVVPETKFYVDWVKPIHDELEQNSNFWRTLPTMIKPIEIPFYIECYISAVKPHIREDREYWLRSNGYQNRPLHLSYEKDKLINELGINIHVDDKLQTIIDINNNCPNCVGILHLPWYLRYANIPDSIIVTTTVEELNTAIQKLIKNTSSK